MQFISLNEINESHRRSILLVYMRSTLFENGFLESEKVKIKLCEVK